MACDERAKHPRHRYLAQSALEQDTESGECERERDVGGESDGQRLEHRRGVGDGDDEDHAGKRKPGHGKPRETPASV